MSGDRIVRTPGRYGAKETSAGFRVFGRAVLLGAGAGFVTGAVAGEAMTLGTQYAGAGLLFGGAVGIMLGTVLGACVGPLMARRAAATEGRPRRTDRILVAAGACGAALAACLSMVEWETTRAVVAAAVAMGVAGTAVLWGLGWVMAPARPARVAAPTW
jgi:hypothetical protein